MCRSFLLSKRIKYEQILILTKYVQILFAFNEVENIMKK
jgi:hypothetical protein